MARDFVLYERIDSFRGANDSSHAKSLNPEVFPTYDDVPACGGIRYGDYENFHLRYPPPERRIRNASDNLLCAVAHEGGASCFTIFA